MPLTGRLAGLSWVDLGLGRGTWQPGLKWAAVEVGAADALWQMYTSGTTGTPKGAVLSHGAVCWNIVQVGLAHPVFPGDRGLAVLPMFLFSGTFFSLSAYPAFLRVVVEVLPLHHGVAMMRALSYGTIDWGLLGHIAYFVAMAYFGIRLTTKRLSKLLLS